MRSLGLAVAVHAVTQMQFEMVCNKRRSTGFAGGDAFGALEVADVADDGVDLFGWDIGYW